MRGAAVEKNASDQRVATVGARMRPSRLRSGTATWIAGAAMMRSGTSGTSPLGTRRIALLLR